MKEEYRPFERVLTPDEIRDLLVIVGDPGWKSLLKLMDNVIQQWAEEAVRINPNDMEGDKWKYTVIFNKGRREGLIQFLDRLTAWKRSLDKKKESGKIESGNTGGTSQQNA